MNEFNFCKMFFEWFIVLFCRKVFFNVVVICYYDVFGMNIIKCRVFNFCREVLFISLLFEKVS